MYSQWDPTLSKFGKVDWLMEKVRVVTIMLHSGIISNVLTLILSLTLLAKHLNSKYCALRNKLSMTLLQLRRTSKIENSIYHHHHCYHPFLLYQQS